MARYSKKFVARSQVGTALWLFLDDRDRSSVITLAGAASGLLEELVRREGKESLIDYSCRLHGAIAGKTPKRAALRHHADKHLGIIAHKHLGPHEPSTVALDLERMAADALGRAVIDLMVIADPADPIVQNYFAWAKHAYDVEHMKRLYGQLPASMKRER